VAYAGSELAGTVLAGHDGRRGLLHHLAVKSSHRRHGIGRALVACCLAALKAEGIDKTHLFVFGANESGRAFWKRAGWYERPELVLMSYDMG
jgi:N-acetylglutamate synthase